MKKPTKTDAQIAEAAYLLWLEEGQPMGRDQDHWHRARAALEVPATMKKPASKPKAKTAKPKAAAATPAAPKPRKPRAKAKPKT